LTKRPRRLKIAPVRGPSVLTLAFTPVTRLGRAPRLRIGRAGRLSPTRGAQ
jgi:hypothetical protein